MCSWYLEEGPESDVVVSSRVRLARNLKPYPFPNRINAESAEKISAEVKKVVLNCSGCISEEFDFLNLRSISSVERGSLLEKHLISSDLVNHINIGSVLISKDEKVSIMVNEEDHIRIQSIYPGMMLNKAWETSDALDNLLEEKLDYAFDESIGYLTSCPTNVGTGIRASVMVHLPALNMIGYINGLLSTIGKLGIAIRGSYGEGSEATGNMFQISNQVTLGQSEEDIIANINGVITQVIEQERMARNKLMKENKFQLEDRVFRSYGLLTSARLMTSSECMNLLSDLKIGIDLGLIDNISPEEVKELFVIAQPSTLQKAADKSLAEEERDIKRAEIIRKKLMKRES